MGLRRVRAPLTLTWPPADKGADGVESMTVKVIRNLSVNDGLDAPDVVKRISREFARC